MTATGWRMAAARGVLVGTLLLFASCAAQRGAGPGAVLFEGGVDALMPLNDGDTFVYLAQGGTRGERLAMARVASLTQAGDYVVTVREGDTVVGQTHLRRTANSVLVVGELDVTGNIGIMYATPLPLIATPLRGGEWRATSAVDVFRPSDGFRLGAGTVNLTVTNTRDATGDFAVLARRRLLLPDADLNVMIEQTRWLRAGVGELRSEAGVNGKVTERRELVCAVVGGKRVGTCPAP